MIQFVYGVVIGTNICQLVYSCGAVRATRSEYARLIHLFLIGASIACLIFNILSLFKNHIL